MSTVAEIKAAIEHLPAKEQIQLRAWFLRKDDLNWDKQIEDDIRLGRLDDIASAALAELKEGRASDL